MQRLFSNDQAITPDRGLRVVFDPDEIICVRLGEGLCRDASEIARGTQVGVGSSTNVDLVSDRWQLTTIQHDPSTINEETAFQDLVIPATDFNYAVPFGTVGCPVSEYNNFRVPTDIPGVTALPSVQTTGDTFTRKDVTAGYSTASYELTADLAQVPKPPPCLNANIPVDRLGVGRVTYPENCGFHLRFIVPGTQLDAPDVIGAFYFGGFVYNPNSVSGAAGGIFALVLYGNGDAELWELIFTAADAFGDWGVRCRFSFSPPAQVAGRVHGITIQPHGTNTISFRIASASRAVSQGRSASVSPSYAGTPPTPHAARFIASALVSGYLPGNVITGAGNLRIDVRRNLLLAWQISILDYQGTGTLVDHEFMWGAPLPGGTVMTMATNVILPAGCAFDANMFAADDPQMTSPLPKVYLGGWVWQFSTLPGKRAYFAAFSFAANSAKHTSPQLRRFSIAVDASFANRTGQNVVFPVDQTDELEVSITGTDGDPSHESAHIYIVNLDGSLVLPRRWGRLKTRVDLGYVDPGASEVNLCYLFDGQGIAVERTPFGAAADDYSSSGVSPFASVYDGTFAGKWARGHEVFSYRHIMLGDFNLAVDLETGKGPALLVTDLIRDVFINVIGVHPDMLDIPNVGIPFAGPEVGKDVMLQPKQNPFEYILHLVANYLGWILFWDRNAAPLGRWRIKPKIDLYGPQSDPLYSFVFGPDSFRNLDPIAPESYPPETTWIERDSYQDWPEAPEYNFITVVAPDTSSYLPSEGGLAICKQIAWNPNSFNIDPANPTANPDPDVNPDYVGEMLPLAVYDPTVGTISPGDGGVQGYVDALARYLIEQYGHARKLFRFRAPFFPAKDATDPYLAGRRPLRHNDPIMVGGIPAIVKSCNLEGPMRNDFQMQWIQGVFQQFPTVDSIA